MLARRRHRSVTTWVVLGAISGPIAALLVLLAPLGQCPMCWAPVKGWGSTCVWCGSDVHDHGTATAGRPSAPRARHVAATLADALAQERHAASLPTPSRAPGSAQRGEDAPTSDGGLNAAPPTAPTAPAMAPQAAAEVRSDASGKPPTEPTAFERVGARRAEHLAPVDEASRSAGEPRSVVNLPVAGPQVLGSAIFVTGSVGLRAGSWYTLELDGSGLAIRGPLEVDPRAAVLVRPLGEIDSYAFNGQLIVHGERGLVLVFMRVSGDTADHLAEVIADAARGAGEAAS